MRILFLGDVVGDPGRRAVIRRLRNIKIEHQIDAVVVNGENAAGGRGITPAIAIDLFRAGVDVLTLGDHTWDQKEILPFLDIEPRLLRPINFINTPGNGQIVIEVGEAKLGIINALGRTFINPPLDNPFPMVENAALAMREAHGDIPILVDFHAEATSEKIAMGRHLDGKVSVVLGTHTHVQTADERIFPGGTAFLCDAGMCGPDDSVLGRAYDSVVYRFKTGLPTRFPVAKGPVRLCGAITEVSVGDGKALKIERYNELIQLD